MRHLNSRRVTIAPGQSVQPRPNRQRLYLIVAAALLALYVVGTAVAWQLRGVDENGPLRESAPELTADVPGAAPLADIRRFCLAQSAVSNDEKDQKLRVTTGVVRGQRLFGCYGYYDSDPDKVWGAAVLDAQGRQVRDVDLLQASGAWRWIGLVKSPGEVVGGGFAMLAVLFVWWRYWRQPPSPPDRPVWRQVLLVVLSLLPCLGWAIGFAVAEPGQRVRFMFQTAVRWFWIGFGMAVIAWLGAAVDGFGGMVVGLLLAALLWGWLGGRQFIPRGVPALSTPYGGYPPGQGYYQQGPPAYPPPDYRSENDPAFRQPAYQPAYQPPAQAQAQAQAPQQTPRNSQFRVRPPSELPTFADVGGMAQLKADLENTLGLMLAYATEADQYRIEFNGVLLHGKPGVGKTFVAQAAAGEYGLNFIHVSTGDLVSSYVGQGAANVEAAFAAAAAHLPCLLFFDEFDSVASRRDEQPNEESRRVVNQLLTSVERFRQVDELVVMAATNHLDQLDPAAIRPGRFDRHVRVDLPDAEARKAIFQVLLAGRPAADVSLDELVRRTQGMTPATLEAVVEAAAMSALQQSVETATPVPITTAHLTAALQARGGKDRPHLAGHDWDDVILPEPVKRELQQVQRLVEDPALAERYGVDPPSGLLLTGPPGTGKTTLARVLAAQTRCSFYVVSPADVTSKWVGESENRIQQLFERARTNAPSIVFLDEIDALAGKRGELGTSGVDTAILTQLLTQLDGLEERGRVFVIGATNRPETVDPALLRPGRLSRVLEIPLPDAAGREHLLGLFTENMRLHEVELAGLAAETAGWSGADLEGLCQQAAVHAMMTAAAGEQPQVETADFTSALTTLRASRDKLAAAREAAPSLNDHLDALLQPRTAAPEA